MRCTYGCSWSEVGWPTAARTARALDYSLKRWKALSGFLDDGDVAIDNNHSKTRCVLGLSEEIM